MLYHVLTLIRWKLTSINIVLSCVCANCSDCFECLFSVLFMVNFEASTGCRFRPMKELVGLSKSISDFQGFCAAFCDSCQLGCTKMIKIIVWIDAFY